MKILKCCLSCPVPIMTHVIENNILYQHIHLEMSYFLIPHMSLYLKYQGIY